MQIKLCVTLANFKFLEPLNTSKMDQDSNLEGLILIDGLLDTDGTLGEVIDLYVDGTSQI